jgi:hypothetical protein
MTGMYVMDGWMDAPMLRLPDSKFFSRSSHARRDDLDKARRHPQQGSRSVNPPTMLSVAVSSPHTGRKAEKGLLVAACRSRGGGKMREYTSLHSALKKRCCSSSRRRRRRWVFQSAQIGWGGSSVARRHSTVGIFIFSIEWASSHRERKS